VTSSCWSELGVDEEILRSEGLKREARYGAQMRDLLEVPDGEGSSIAMGEAERWQTIGRLVQGGVHGHETLVDEHSKLMGTDVKYANKLLRVAGNRERVDGGAVGHDEKLDQRYRNRLARIRGGQIDRQERVLRQRDRQIYIGNNPAQKGERMDQEDDGKVKGVELALKEGTGMDRKREIQMERLVRDRERRELQEWKEELTLQAKARKLADYRHIQVEEAYKKLEKQEMKMLRDREKADEAMEIEKRLHKKDGWSAGQALRDSGEAQMSAEDARIGFLKERRIRREEEQWEKREKKDGWGVGDALRVSVEEKKKEGATKEEAKIEALAQQRLQRERAVEEKREEERGRRRGRKHSVFESGMGDIFRTATSVPRGVLQKHRNE